MDEKILNNDQLYNLLDSLLRDPIVFWDDFYEDRDKKIPFFKNSPDENLVEYFRDGLNPTLVLEIGCGPGRNAIYMAKQGCEVDGLDLSKAALKWAQERADEAGANINFICKSLFDFNVEPYTYDFIYDSGMFHHLAPHRRITYLNKIRKALKPNGYFGIVCFNTDGAPASTDWEIYRDRSLKGGIGYSEERFREIFEEHFNIIHLRTMKNTPPQSGMFGIDFLWTSLMQIKGE
ncbi:SAM-dependent methyltransferase [Lottiidibacillus patelloidae]|uniref:SAM-dependent methyltransferase n=1 Tax=Lottiidibacillus patelloidae TaxID=2670334 RepID=A0A263BWX8_9BACI|nr:class I SAM-dependent methyltransferase [Lottiidibacillus patelloidae]OZM58225.1 SAM-dependent methyltransferase [Lottiidibacillus patelloidae]